MSHCCRRYLRSERHQLTTPRQPGVLNLPGGGRESTLAGAASEQEIQ